MAKQEASVAGGLPVISLLIKYRSVLSWCLLIALLIGVWTVRYIKKNSATQNFEYIEAEETFIGLQDGQLDVSEVSGAISRILASHEELQQKYGGPLAQMLVQAGEANLAEESILPSFERAGEELSPYVSFGQVTLLIAHGDYEAALASSQELKERLSSAQPYLMLMNCLRIALLSGEIGDALTEKAAWKELIVLLEDPLSQEVSAQAREEMLQTFRNGQVSLIDYAKARYSEL